MTIDVTDKPKVYVGIGASAGGLQALRQLLPGLPCKDGFTYVLIQHMDPKHPNTLDQILAKETALTVEPAVHGARMLPDHLYITPSDKDCTVVDGTLQLAPVHNIGPRHSVDSLFASLANSQGKAAVGIVLSGTGSDGERGAHELKAANGLVLTQDPSDAEHAGMPGAILQAHLADIVAPAAKLGVELGQIVDRAGKTQLTEGDILEATRTTLLNTLLRKTAFAFDQYKDSTLTRRIERRMTVNKLDTLEDYVAFIDGSDTEAKLLLKDMQISVTGFFRDSDAFKAIAVAIEAIIARKKTGETIRIWVPGCATGEEAFSIAILVAEALGDRLNGANVQIFATDVDVGAIEHARKSLYLKTLLANMPSRLVDKYFDALDGTCKVRSRIRDLVVFADHDLMQDPPFARLDLISCRNVLIYFKRAAQERLLTMFHYVLNSGGTLVLGTSEGIGSLSELFEPANASAKLFVRKDVERPPPTLSMRIRGRRLPAPELRAAGVVSVEERIRDAIFEQFAPPSILVDERFDIVHLNGELAPFMQLPQGDITVNALELVNNPLRLELRLMLQKSQRARTVERSRTIEISGADSQLLVTMNAVPTKGESDDEHYTLVLFQCQSPVERVVSANATNEASEFRIRELEQELIATRDHLQTNIEDLEASNEELQSINEEFQSTSEELQSANEELQTTNEELQSTNEELRTVNDELRNKTDELEAANTDLQGILNTVVEGIVVLDEEMRVTRYSAGAKMVLDLLPTSIGRPLLMVGGTIDLTLLATEIRSATQTKQPVDRELELGDIAYLVRMIPQRDGGLIISFTDETERIRTSRESRRLATLVRDSNDAITVQDTGGRILAWNRGAERLYGYDGIEALSMNITQIVVREEEEQAIDLIRRLMAGEAVESFEGTRRAKDGREFEVWVTATALRDDDGKPYAIATTERDLTERKIVEAAERESINADEQSVRDRIERLTKREREVLTLLVAGSANTSSRQIAELLGISARTVDTHRQHIKEKLGAQSMSDLVSIARSYGL